MRVLIVEDDDIVADAVARGLCAEHWSVKRAASAEAALAALAAGEFDLAIVDVGLPGSDGLSFIRRLRGAGKTLPTLVLTARCTLADRVKALDLGADDFLAKPFEAPELAARCRALVRRAHGAQGGVIKMRRLSIDLAGRRLCIDQQDVELTAREWLMLECLVKRVGLIVSKERLLQALAHPDQEMSANAVEVHVSRLRAKLGEAAVIRSLRGLGYRLEEPGTPP
ncbi:MAG: response regulator transcription factor [Steroidobacteraceae bacterium]|nr:response regulator transcription factor [Steroidobacteraceae bacterium]